MFFLGGAAATGALDLISSLQQVLGGGNSAAQSSNTFDPTSTAGASAGTPASATASASAPASPLSSSTLSALFSMQGQGQGGAQQPLLMVNGDALSQQMFSLLDGNGDGGVSQSEFDQAFGQNGNTTQANNLFAQIDTNGDGSISQQELTNALDGQDQAQGQGQGQGVGGHHHHHHGGGFDLASLLGGASADGGAGGTTGSGATTGAGANAGLGANLTGDATQTVTNSDGSSTTTITYADGSKVSMTIPAANGSSQSGGSSSGQNGGSGALSAASLNNFVEQMIQRQAQMLATTSVGQSVAVSA